MSPYPRDSQRGKIYDAENRAKQSLGRSYTPTQLESLAEGLTYTKAWMDALVFSPAGEPYAEKTVRVRSRSSCVAYVDSRFPNRIELPVNRMSGPYSVCHAMAHLPAPPSDVFAWHSPNFASEYLRLVHGILPDMYDALRTEFESFRVKRATLSVEEAREKLQGKKQRTLEAQAKKHAELQESLLRLVEKFGG